MGTLRVWLIVHLPAVLTVGSGVAVLGCGGGRADERRYENGRTYIEQVNHCNLMRDQGVPCTVPAPP